MENDVSKLAAGAGRGDAVRAERFDLPLNPRLKRLRFMSRLLDNSILLPGGYRIGIDPIIGLVPGIGDVIATSLSLWIVYQGALMGLPKRILARMGGNVLVETLVGTIPILGDLFDAAWKANARNMKLVELSFHQDLKERNPRRILAIFLLLAIGLLVGIFWLAIAVLNFIISLFT